MKGKQNPRSHLVLQLIGLGYVVYLLVGMVQDFRAGEAPVSLPVFCLVTFGLGAAAIVLAVFAYRGWKRDQTVRQELEEEDASAQKKTN